MKRWLTSLLVLSMLSSTFAACTEAPTETESTLPEETVPETETEIPDSLPELDYDGYTFTTYCRSDLNHAENFSEGLNGEIVNDAIFNRNIAVEERLNVTFAFDARIGDFSNISPFAKEFANSVLAGDGAYDMVSGYSLAVPVIALDGCLIDLTDTQYLDFSQPWWPESLLQEITVGGKLFFASGDISSFMLYMMVGIFFNKEILEDYNLPDPYDIVREGKWTLEKLRELSTGVYTDLNGNGERDMHDRYGYLGNTVYQDSLYFATGLRYTTINEEGIPVLSPDFQSEKMVEMLDFVLQLIYETDGCILFNKYYQAGDPLPFQTGNALFNLEEVDMATKYDLEFTYGLLPVPKWEEQQELYYSTLSFPYNLFGIPIDSTDKDMSSAVMEALAAESYRKVSPALFETALKKRYASGDDDAEMFDIIRRGIVFDFGRIFSANLSNLTYSLFRDAVWNNKNNWASTSARNAGILENNLNKVTSKLIAFGE